jgi:hypothetical protein
MPKQPSEHALAIIKASLSGVPVVGGSIASLVSDYIPTATQRSIDEALRQLAKKLQELQDRLDVDAVDKDEFSELFKSSYLLLLRSHQKEKTDAALALIINLLLEEGDEDKLCYTELDHFARCLDLLSIGALQVLRTIFGIYKQIVSKPEPFRERSHLTFGGLQSNLPDLGPSLMMGLLSELAALNLVYLPPAPAIRTAGNSNQQIEMTALGVRFINNLLSVWWDRA